MDSPKTYSEKRDFHKTPEPKASASKGPKSKEPIFVIQKHDARNLHYDFRLEIDGVLKSWAVPKGPSIDPSEKRLAIPTEDHPMEYADFEGVIPEGQYGAGTVMVWDKGSYENLMTKKDKSISMKESYENGHIEIRLNGEKLTGGFALIESKGGNTKGNWFLIKMKDDHADARRKPKKTENKSLKTGRTMKQIKQGTKENA